MPDLTIKRNDNRPSYVVPLKEGSGSTVLSLTTATSVKLIMDSGAVNVVRNCPITNASAGEVTLTFAGTDTTRSGTYRGEFEITWNDGGIETVPNDAYISILIIDDLG